MDLSSMSDLHPVGIDLFDGFDGLVQDLSEDDEVTISGGGRSRSRSNSDRRRKRRRRRRRLRRRRQRTDT
jgi:hypothetical protein